MPRPTPRLLSPLFLTLSLGTAIAQPPGGPTPPPPPPTPAERPAPAELTPIPTVEVRGEGPIPILLIPGHVSDWRIFEPFMDRNKARYTMYALSLPGHAKSDPPPLPGDAPPSRTLWLDNAAAAILKLVEERKLDHPVVAGQLLGGTLALRLAAEHPDSFRAAISINGLAAYPLKPEHITREQRADYLDHTIAPALMQLPGDMWEDANRSSAASMVKSNERANDLADMMNQTPSKVGKRYMLELMACDFTAEMKGLKIPALVCIALSDEYPTGWAQMKEIVAPEFADSPKVTLVYFEDTRHLITDDAPAELDAAIENFLAGKPVTGKTRPPQPGPAEPPAKPADPSPAPPAPGSPK